MKMVFILLLLLITTQFGLARQALTLSNKWVDTGSIFSKPVASIFYKPPVYQNKVVKEIPKDLYTCNFGFFCKQELKMHKAHVPVSVRLGSFEYCDYLEQKGSSVK
jgi:hypothetical protein